MISRRHLFATAGSVTLASAFAPGFLRAAAATDSVPALPFPPLQNLSFRISRKDCEIGTHSVSFSGSAADNLTATIDVDMVVKIAFIPVFRYSHKATEKWANNQFVSLDAKTDYNGDAAHATVRRDTVRRDKGGLIVEGSKAPQYIASSNALAATHWNSAELRGPMINPENGILLNPRIACAGNTDVALASGTTVPATKFTWRGKDTLDLWYKPNGQWTALTGQAGDGSTLTYELA